MMIKLFIALALIASIPGLSQSNAQLSIMTFNVRNARGMDEKVDYSRIAAIIQKYSPDVVSLQELDSASKRSNGENVLAKIAGLTNYQYAYAPAIAFEGGKYGIGILYKEKPLAAYNVPLPGTEEQRTLQVAEFSSFVLFNSHLSLTESDRNKSGNIINERLHQFDKPVFLTGDLNAEPGTDLIRALKKSWTQLSPDSYTFPSTGPNVQIDYIFADNRHASSFEIVSREVVPDSMASDHRAVIVTLRRK